MLTFIDMTNHMLSPQMAHMAARLKPFYLLLKISVSQLIHTASGPKRDAWLKRSGRMTDRATF